MTDNTIDKTMGSALDLTLKLLEVVNSSKSQTEKVYGAVQKLRGVVTEGNRPDDKVLQLIGFIPKVLNSEASLYRNKAEALDEAANTILEAMTTYNSLTEAAKTLSDASGASQTDEKA